MGSWLCVKSTSASDGDICSHYKNKHRIVFMLSRHEFSCLRGPACQSEYQSGTKPKGKV